jgi:hypothetical protein
MIIELIMKAVIGLVIGFVTGYVGGLIYDHFTNKTYNVSKSKVKGNNSTVIQNLNTNNEDGF